MSDCIFCKIATGEIQAEKIFESDDILGFSDLNPAAPVHVIIIPKRHYATTLEMSDKEPELFGAMIKASSEIARAKGIAESGFRLILNTNADAGQEIFHVHMHLLGGKRIGRLIER